MNEIHGFQISLDGGRNCVIDRSESGDSGEILAPLNAGVKVQDRETLVLKPREDLLLQMIFHHIQTHSPR